MFAKLSNAPNRHVYKIVTYGRPSSGKTCMLAAMAMARDAHPLGYAATWVHDETTIPKPPGDQNSWDHQDPVVARFLGRECLPTAISELENGRLPPATPMTISYRFLFDFTTPDGCIRRVEMIDYSGELVDPEITEGDFAKQLINHMETADAILVLAEATVTEVQAERVLRDLHKLREALALVSDNRRRACSDPFPVGLVYDKWDRWSQMEDFSSDAAQLELNHFLDQQPPPPHVALRNVLQAVAGEQHFFHEFVASAFGKAKQVIWKTEQGPREVEIPATVLPMPSYGLEDPFIEVCRSADELELTRLNREMLKLSPWKLWQLPNRLAMRLRSTAKRFAKRFPPHIEHHKQAIELSSLAGRRFAQQIITALCVTAFLFTLSVECWFVIDDELRFAEYSPAINKPFHESNLTDMEATLPQWQKAERYLGAFQTRTWYRLVSQWRNSPKRADGQRLELQDRIARASVMIEAREKLSVELQGIQARAGLTHSASETQAEIERLNRIKLPVGFSKLEMTKVQISESLKKRHTIQIHEEGFAILQSDINKSMETGNLTDAANLICQNGPKYPEQYDSLKSNFRKAAPELIRKIVTRLCEPLGKSSNNWSGAESYLQRLESNDAFITLMGNDFRGKLSRAQIWVVKHQQLMRYREWYDDKNNPTKAQQARRVGYRETIDRYDQYAKDCNSKRDWTVNIVRLHFIDDGARSTTNAKIVAFSDDELAGTVSPFIGKGDEKDADGSGEVKISGQSVDSEFIFSINVKPTNWYYGSAGATGRMKTSISALSAAEKKFICGMAGDDIQCEVYISVDPKLLPAPGDIPIPMRPSDLEIR
ncbi:MAG: hypothetical protein JWM11_966 [Planctomycetaceae bacterium]|nr:hypothetical protein [Planctomycetaceae bacterium]